MEKILRAETALPTAEKHLHIRGENLVLTGGPLVNKETPPHTWRKWISRSKLTGNHGNTSTYVEKMFEPGSATNSLWKHLHIRGENPITHPTRRRIIETPPHTWRKSTIGAAVAPAIGNTSTYVEKISSGFIADTYMQKHLHIRGENSNILK